MRFSLLFLSYKDFLVGLESVYEEWINSWESKLIWNNMVNSLSLLLQPRPGHYLLFYFIVILRYKQGI